MNTFFSYIPFYSLDKELAAELTAELVDYDVYVQVVKKNISRIAERLKWYDIIRGTNATLYDMFSSSLPFLLHFQHLPKLFSFCSSCTGKFELGLAFLSTCD
jgi:hypothetical protein